MTLAIPRAHVTQAYRKLTILGPESVSASRAALAASKQGAYLQFHQALMKLDGAVSTNALEAIAADLKLDMTKWRADVASPEIEQALRANQELAAAIGAQATPTFVAGSELVSGALDQKAFAALIERARTQVQQASRTH